MFWINKIFQLAIDWQLNLDDLRIHQVIWLYVKGCDRLAEEVRNNFSLNYFKLKTKQIIYFYRLYLLSIIKIILLNNY